SRAGGAVRGGRRGLRAAREEPDGRPRRAGLGGRARRREEAGEGDVRGGRVGSLAIQIGKILGLRVATTTSTRNVELVRGLGADEVIDYTKHEPLPEELDAAFDTLGGASELASIAAVKRGGTVVGIGGLPDEAFARARLPAWVRPALWLLTRRRRRAAT